MKLPEAKFKSQIFGAEKEMSFSIESENSVIFDILRDKMYSNKIGAVCREVASNSRDANRESGRGDIATKISIREPNTYISVSGMSISFEDNGNGISPDRMESIFLKYGASTKRDTNDQTGGFGLGAKTPFAYKDTFTVITVCQDTTGIITEYTYNAMIDSTRKGKMVLFDSEIVDSNSSTGTKIIVPIDPDDKYTFEQECIKATCLWDTPPVYVGFSQNIPEIEHISEDKSIKVKSIKSGFLKDKKFILLIDGIPYPIDDISEALKSDKKYVGIDGCQVIIPFENGELTIAANRETVQYDEETISKIQKRLVGIDRLVKKEIKRLFKDIRKLKSFINTNILYADYRSGTEHSWSHCEDSIASRLKQISESSTEFHILIAEGWTLLQKGFGRKFNKDGIRLKYHKVYKVSGHTDSWNNKSALTRQDPTSFIKLSLLKGKRLEELYIVKDKQRLDGRKNKTIFDKNSNEFYCIIENKEYSSDEAIQELDDITFLFGLDMKFYADVERSAIQRSPSGSRVSKDKYEEKWLPARIYSGCYDAVKTTEASVTITYKPEIQMTSFFDKRDISKHCFHIVDKLGDIATIGLSAENIRNMNFLYTSRDIKTVIVSKRTFDKYLKDFEALKIENILKEEISIAVKAIEVDFDKVKGQYLRDNISKLIRKNKELKQLLPKQMIHLIEGVSHKHYSYPLELIDSVAETNFVSRLAKIKSDLNQWKSDYTVIRSYISDNRWDLEYERDNCKDIISNIIDIHKLISARKSALMMKNNPKIAKFFKNKPKR